MIIFLIFLYHLQPSAAIPLPYRGSNSEEQGAPYGSYNYPNLQMPQLGPMYGFGLPYYSQMIQLQQALAQQPSTWQTQRIAQIKQNNRERLSHQIPSYQIKPQLPKQPSIPLPQPQPNYQHVTKQPLQLPPAPDPQIPQMFLPFLNPGNPFWPQGNYFGYYGFGGRPPYNSEEANEDEEAVKEKESPAAEPPVTESSNTTVDTNSTTVDQGLGNSTGQNESFMGQNIQSTNDWLDGQSIYSSGIPMTPNAHERHINILPGPRRPSHQIIGSPHYENFKRNQQQKYYTRVLIGRGDHPGTVYSPDTLLNKSPPTHHLPSEKRVFSTGELHSYGDKFHQKLPMARESEIREILHSPTRSIIRNGVQQHNGNNLLNHREFSKDVENRQQREHSLWMGNKNNVPKSNVIIVQPERKEYFTEYSRHPLFEEKKQNIPRGIFSNHHNSYIQPKSGTVQKNIIYENQGTPDSQKSNTPLKTDDPYKQSLNIDTWSKREITEQISTGDSVGPPQETIYLVSTLPSDNGNPTEQKINLDYLVSHRIKNIYPDNDFYGKTNTAFYSENQNQHVNDFTTQFNNFHFQPYSWVGSTRDTQGPSAEQNIRKLYNTNDRYTNSPQFLLIAKPGPLKTQEQPQFSTNEPSSHFKELSPGYQNPINNLDHTAYIPEYETNSQPFSTQYGRSKLFDPLESDQYNHGEELHHGHKSPAHLQMSPFPQTQPWIYNPEDIPSEQKEYSGYGSYPSGMRGQLPYEKKVGMHYEGSRLYTCTLPFAEYDSGRGFPDSLLYVCCKLTYVEQGNPPGAVDGANEFRLTLKENKGWVPNQERIHRQHTRNVMDPPNIGYNRQSNSGTPSCNVSNINENVINSRGEYPEGIPAFDEQNLEYPYQGLDDIATTPCHARGDANNYMYPKQVLNSQKKIFTGNKKLNIIPINVQDDGSIHGEGENDVRVKKGPGKLLRILTCPQAQMKAADMPASLDINKPKAFSMNNNIPDGHSGVDTQDGSLALNQLSGNDPVNSTPDCLILNK